MSRSFGSTAIGYGAVTLLVVVSFIWVGWPSTNGFWSRAALVIGGLLLGAAWALVPWHRRRREAGKSSVLDRFFPL